MLGSIQLGAQVERAIHPFLAERVLSPTSQMEAKPPATVDLVGALSTFEALRLPIHIIASQERGGPH